MDLPLRMMDAATHERVVSVDGAWNQPGLNLSHWPGNATPKELKRDLSTEIALAFARLPLADRARLTHGCVAIANNHYDTDGVCALFAVRYPERALELESELVHAARAGDFFALPDERAFQVDAIVAGLADPARSPWRDRFAKLDDHARREWVMRELVEQFDAILAGDLAPYEMLWKSELERLRADRAQLANAARDDIAHFDLCVYTSRGAKSFDPGRHALFGSTTADRILAIGERAAGATYRFLIGTSSWFDMVSRKPLARPALERLADELNASEGTSNAAAVAWRCQPTASPSPELWFGRAQPSLFAEHAHVLETSRLAPEVVRPIVVEALRATWTFPDED